MIKFLIGIILMPFVVIAVVFTGAIVKATFDTIFKRKSNKL